MTDLEHFKKVIEARLSELGVRMQDIEDDLSHEKTRDVEDRAIDLEDEEVLESLGIAAEKEAGLLKLALQRIKNGTYGTCARCEEPISKERLMAVPYAVVCRTCATAAQN